MRNTFRPIHFYLPGAPRTACGVPNASDLVSRQTAETTCHHCLASSIWENAAALQMERSLEPPPIDLSAATRKAMSTFSDMYGFFKYLPPRKTSSPLNTQ